MLADGLLLIQPIEKYSGYSCTKQEHAERISLANSGKTRPKRSQQIDDVQSHTVKLQQQR